MEHEHGAFAAPRLPDCQHHARSSARAAPRSYVLVPPPFHLLESYCVVGAADGQKRSQWVGDSCCMLADSTDPDLTRPVSSVDQADSHSPCCTSCTRNRVRIAHLWRSFLAPLRAHIPVLLCCGARIRSSIRGLLRILAQRLSSVVWFEHERCTISHACAFCVSWLAWATAQAGQPPALGAAPCALATP